MISVLVLFLCTTATAKRVPCGGKSKSNCTGACAWFPITQSCIGANEQPLLQHCSQVQFFPVSEACNVDCDKLGKVEAKPATATKVAVCGADKQCTCANGGVGAKGTVCPKDNTAKCVSCSGKFFLHNNECKAWTDCDKIGKVQTKPASNTADATCGAEKTCTCANGTGASGTACPKDKDAKCVKCNDGFTLEKFSCQAAGFQASGIAWDPASRRRGTAGTPGKDDGTCVLSESNTKVTLNNECGIMANKCFTSGMWYWEVSFSGSQSEGQPFHANVGITREDADLKWFDMCKSVMWYAYISSSTARHLPSGLIGKVPSCNKGSGKKAMYFVGKCPHSHEHVECIAGEPSATSRVMFALDMDKGLFWMGHDGKWDYTQGETIDKSNFDTLALKLPDDTFTSGKAWCPSAMGERGAAVKLHVNKSDWKFGPPTKDFQVW